MDDRLYSLGLLVSRASIWLAKSLNASLEASNIDLPHSQFIVLRCLYYKDALSQLEIAQILSKDAAAIKRTIDNLEKKGLAVRIQVRNLKNSVCITDKGRELMPQALKVADRIIEEALAGFAEKDRKQLKDMLTKVYTNLKERERKDE
ncbi:MarR family winged helix-turn-helix transcriptional regulator [Dysgonomonas macrotermitis]|uniref:DNA-binding transcriptional regulator, MarR family n=1 Tax=Dysgonomonas macrotermitis TaxID=1346286 RepID=A0A1M4T297_9BACT|nr:MarR family transcriptional regulator [Dysgonomonas macrotermitis]SHE38571.1 DNA-binding transcriptional regulator, MarR family [Dysgonomonas macrotermitis]